MHSVLRRIHSGAKRKRAETVVVPFGLKPFGLKALLNITEFDQTSATVVKHATKDSDDAECVELVVIRDPNGGYGLAYQTVWEGLTSFFDELKKSNRYASCV